MPRRNRWPESPSQKRKKRNHKRKPARERNMRLQQNARITGKRWSTTTHFVTDTSARTCAFRYRGAAILPLKGGEKWQTTA